MIPRWKIRRELLRLARQITGLPRKIASTPSKIAQRREVLSYRRDFHKLVQLTEGEVPLGQKVVIFLLYQPKSIPGSVFLTLTYLLKSGYTPLIVINGKVPQGSESQLRRYAWLLLQRPNFGYDFGGYQDGIRLLQERGIDPERLIIMNDSVWFPMSGDPIQTVEAHLDEHRLDAAGLNQDEKIRYQPDGSVKYELRHIESYFYLFSSEFWKSDLFRSFWRQYRMSSDKSYTIKNGEIGFSAYAMARGAKFSGLLCRSLFLERIESCPSDFLRLVLNYGAYADANYAREAQALLASYEESDVWRQRALAHLRNVALRRPFNTSFCLAWHELFGMTYLKKNSQTYFHDMRNKYLLAIEDGHIASPDPILHAEVKALVASHDPRTAERTL